MTLVVLVFLSLLAIGAPNTIPLHPSALTLLTNQSSENIVCDEDDLSPTVLEAPAPTRASQFSLSGTYKCHRPVFTEKERDPYIDLVLVAESKTAMRVALDVQKRLSENLQAKLSRATKPGPAAASHSLERLPILIHVEGVDDPLLKDKIAAIYRSSLAHVMSSGNVSHSLPFETEDGNAPNNSRLPLLSIQMYRVDVPELLSTARLRLPNEKGEPVWLAL